MELLPLNDIRWASLHSTYSKGRNVAALLGRLKSKTSIPQPEKEELWQELCHQYQSTEAGYGAIPHLVSFSIDAPPDQALEFLAVAAHILSCTTQVESDLIPDFIKSQLEKTKAPALGKLGQLIGWPHWSEEAKRSLLAAIASFMDQHPLYFLIESSDCRAD